MYQSDPPLSAKEVLPTMYDLPSEDPEEPGLPDEFHLLQPRLLDETFRPPNYPSEQIFVASDLNLYYDVRHTLWYKRPDWFAVVGGERLYEQRDLRLSYVVWQEGVNPFIMVELLSPGTEKEDLGQTLRSVEQPPTKWQVYEQILRIPYYAIFDRYSQNFQMFKLDGGRYRAVELEDERFWIPELELGLGVWQGRYQDIEHSWLRWYDGAGNWMLTPSQQQEQRAQQQEQRAQQQEQRAQQQEQRAEQEKQRAQQQEQRAQQQEQRAERLVAQLRSLGIKPDLE
ncbi:MAG: Uma2 family endonuclease [Desmonostoc vinosum HA7617-LM4]|nr:Uma2 family endonuclease [Desmonostoc vinosum HA7617-LM4]